MKNASAMYAQAVPNIEQQTKDQLLSNNLNYQKDLNEVAIIVAKNLAGREKEIGEGMAQVYANEFTEQELKDLVNFYKSPLGQKLLATQVIDQRQQGRRRDDARTAGPRGLRTTGRRTDEAAPRRGGRDGGGQHARHAGERAVERQFSQRDEA